MFPHRTRAWLSDRRFHEFLWYSVPGVLAGLFLRVWLTAALPYGYYHPDTHDFMTTAFVLQAHHHWTIHGKTTFLTPLLYTLAFFPKLPALGVIPLAQHARGLLLVLMTGALARLWFTRWRWWIVPMTILVAMQPAMLFWEHALMSESGFVFCAVGLALAGTVFARWPDRTSYGLLLAAMFCVAAARPEGNLWQGAGILLVLLVYRKQWKREWVKIAGVIAFALGMLSITKTSHSGLLLYASLVHLTPDHPRAVPDFGPYIQPLRDKMIAQRNERVSDDVVRASKRVNDALTAYIEDHPHARLGLAYDKKQFHREQASGQAEDDPEVDLRYSNNISDLCRRLAIESALSHPFALPGYAWRKFRAPIDADSGGRFEDYEFHEKQAFSLAGKPTISKALGPGLIGSPLDTPEQARAFVDRHYDLSKVGWFNTLEDRWQTAVDSFHLPDTRYSATYHLPGLPVYHLLGMLGAAVALFRPGAARRFHWGFVPVMCGAWFAVMLTAAVIPRHRFVWEPFWLLYGFFFFDSVVALVVSLGRRAPRDTLPVQPTTAPAALP